MSVTSPCSDRVLIDPMTGVRYMPFLMRPIYGKEYFEKYVAYGKTSFGIALNSLRVGLVSRYLESWEPLLDVGIGDGSFIRARGEETFGYDINPYGVELLKQTGRWLDPYACETRMHAVSFWDALEHIAEWESIVKNVDSYCFVSLPIISPAVNIMEWKHYRPKEHCWYFARHGLISMFWDLGFACVEMNEMETRLGREDIGTFVFERKR